MPKYKCNYVAIVVFGTIYFCKREGEIENGWVKLARSVSGTENSAF